MCPGIFLVSVQCVLWRKRTERAPACVDWLLCSYVTKNYRTKPADRWSRSVTMKLPWQRPLLAKQRPYIYEEIRRLHGYAAVTVWQLDKAFSVNVIPPLSTLSPGIAYSPLAF